MVDNDDVVKRLDLIIRLTAAQLVKDMAFREQVITLSNVGLQPFEIAQILGKSSANIRVTLSLVRKKSKKGNKHDE